MRFLLLLALVMPLVLPGAASAADPQPKAHRSAGKPAVAKSSPAAGPTAGTVQRSGPQRSELAISRDARAASSQACSGRNRGLRCRTAKPAQGVWSRGLPPAANAQARECPDGTMATLARGHDDIIRCMPL